jgi:hypothetical protein
MGMNTTSPSRVSACVTSDFKTHSVDLLILSPLKVTNGDEAIFLVACLGLPHL